MKEFEKFLTDLPKPAVEVPAFRDQLLRELSSVGAPQAGSGWRVATAMCGTLAAVLALLVGLFVARPGIPTEIHAALTGAEPALVLAPELPVGLPIDADRAFVDSWTAQQAQPVSVRSMAGERLFSVRQFELTDGKRMLVFNELGDETKQPTILRAEASGSVY